MFQNLQKTLIKFLRKSFKHTKYINKNFKETNELKCLEIIKRSKLKSFKVVSN